MEENNSRGIELEFIEDVGYKLGILLQNKEDWVDLTIDKEEQDPVEEFRRAVDYLQSIVFMSCGFQEYSHDEEINNKGERVSVTCYKMGERPGVFFTMHRKEEQARLQLIDIEDLVKDLTIEQVKVYERAGDPFGLKASKKYRKMVATLK